MPDSEVVPSLSDLTAYLERSGWLLVVEDERSTEWASPRTEGGPRAVLPRSQDVSDYAPVAVAAVRAVAYEERRPPRDVFEDIVLGGADVLAFRFTPSAPDGEAPLRLAQAVVNGARNLIVGAAASIVCRPSFYRHGGPRERRPSGTKHELALRLGVSCFE